MKFRFLKLLSLVLLTMMVINPVAAATPAGPDKVLSPSVVSAQATDTLYQRDVEDTPPPISTEFIRRPVSELTELASTTALPGFGTISGTVRGFQACDINPAPLAGSTVNFRQAGLIVYSTLTNASGLYTYDLPVGIYDVDFVAPGYLIVYQASVQITDGGLVTSNKDLRLLAPCFTVSPTFLEKTQPTNTIANQTLTLSNSGAEAGDFILTETAAAKMILNQLIVDPGFEAYTPNPYWNEYSAAYGTPLCTYLDCGILGPHGGDVWAWFGGSDTGDTAYLSQSVVIPTGIANLSFWVQQPFCGNGGANDWLALKIDNQELWRTDMTNPICGTLAYRQISVDVTAFADGGTHEVRFDSVLLGNGSFFLDDVELNRETTVNIPWLSETPVTGTVPANGSVDLTITYNSTGLTTGDYFAGLRINNPMLAPVNIPVTLHVLDLIPLTITANAATKVFGQPDPVFTYTASDPSVPLTGALSRVAGENVGVYAITQGTLSAGSNYAITFVSANFTITPKPLTITANAATKVFGQPDPVFTYTASDPAAPITGALSREPGENVGVYAITQGTLSAGSNYAITFVSANFTITAKPLTITADAATKVYGQPDPVFTYTASDPSVPLTGALSREPGENVGVYAITQGTLSAGSNYAITFVSANFTITAKSLTITANAATKVFGQPDPVFTYTASDPSVPLTGALSRVAGENVGVYAITQGTLSAGSNYAITFVSANFTITPKPLTITANAATKVFGQPDPVFTYTASDPAAPITGALSREPGENVGVYAITQGTLSAGSNYAITFVSANLTITAKPLTITANAATKVFGQPDPVFTYTASDPSVPLTGALSREPGENVGVYAITQGTLSAGSNYAITFVSANFTITAKPLTITADAATKVFGQPDPVFTYTASDPSVPLTGALSRVAGENVGVYAITQGTLSAGSNYAITFVSANFTITAKPLTITANAATKVFGQPDPVFTYTASDPSVPLTGALSRVAGENVGVYAITQGTLSAGSNYAITFVSADFTITAVVFSLFLPLILN